MARALGWLLHVDDPERLDGWRRWLSAERPPRVDEADSLQRMLFVGLGFATRPVSELGEAFEELWASADLRREAVELLEVLADRARRPTFPLLGVPFHVHATYSRDEISAGLGQVRKGKLLRTQGGVYCDESLRADILYVTLRKNEKEFTPPTLYNDYPISPTRFHWESQSVTRAGSATGCRYQEHAARVGGSCCSCGRARRMSGG